MGKRKEKCSEEKNVIASLINLYDIQSAEDIQDALKDLLGGTIENMLKAELDNHLGYEQYERNESSNARNGNKSKMVRSKYGQLEIDVPQDRDGYFEPQIVKKRQKDISQIEEKIISMYAKGLSTLKSSKKVTVLSVTKRWDKIKYSGKIGYVLCSKIKMPSGTVYWNGESSQSKIYHKTATAHGIKEAVPMTKLQDKSYGFRACKTCH